MKENIDLTDNRDFAKRMDTKRISDAVNRGKYPWTSQIESDIFMIDDMDIHIMNMFIIPLGNSNDREMTKLCREEESGEYCACCGARIHVFPYRSETYDGLCKRCRDELKERVDGDDRIPWRIKEDREPNVFQIFP